jgi:hypothetical protein
MTACVRCETAIEDGDLRCSICALPVSAAARADARPHAQVLRCRECGAAVAFSAEAQAPRCGFCSATMAIEQPVDPIESAELRLPFTVGRDAAEAAARGWLARRGWFAPPALSREAVFERRSREDQDDRRERVADRRERVALDSLTPLSWAAWLVNAQALVTWTADSDAGAHRSAWAPHAGELPMDFRNIVVPASRGLRPSECGRLIPYYELRRAVEVDQPPVEVDDVASTIEGFDAQRSAARRYVQERIDALARQDVEPHIPGRRHRNIHVACLLERQTTVRLALPVWILAYRYRGRPYRAIVHGQRSDIVFGRSPLDWAKVGALAALATLVAAIIVALVLLRG